MARTTEKQAHLAAFFAVAEMGGKFHTSRKDVIDYVKSLGKRYQRALVLDMKEAWACSAFLVERPFYGDNKHGWRLCRYWKGSGQSDVGKMFLTSGAFYDAMHTAADMWREIGGGR